MFTNIRQCSVFAPTCIYENAVLLRKIRTLYSHIDGNGFFVRVRFINPASTWRILFHHSSFYLRKVIHIFLRVKVRGEMSRGKCPRPVMLFYAMLWYAMLCHAVVLCYVILCYLVLCYSALCCTVLCNVMLCKTIFPHTYLALLRVARWLFDLSNSVRSRTSSTRISGWMNLIHEFPFRVTYSSKSHTWSIICKEIDTWLLHLESNEHVTPQPWFESIWKRLVSFRTTWNLAHLCHSRSETTFQVERIKETEVRRRRKDLSDYCWRWPVEYSWEPNHVTSAQIVYLTALNVDEIPYIWNNENEQVVSEMLSRIAVLHELSGC